MKVTLKGKIKLRGNVRRTALGKGSSMRALRRVVRQEVNRGISRMERELARLRAGVRRDLRRELYSPRFANFIGDAVRDPNGLRNIAMQYLNRSVEVITTAGPVDGTLIRVGTDYMVIQETASTLLIVPFSSTIGIRPQL